MACWTKSYLLEFIQLYKDNESLWNTKSSAYTNKKAKDSSYMKMIEKMRHVDPDANQDSVKRKINNIRTTFRKEMKKVRTSKRNSASPDDVYVPKLWYFNNLMFLVEEYQSNDKDNLGSNDDSNLIEDIEIEIETNDESMSTDGTVLETESLMSRSSSPGGPSGKCGRTPSPCDSIEERKLRKKAKKSTSSTDKVLSMVGEKLLATPSDDKFDYYSKHIASKLRELPKNQRIFVEKVINEGLFHAELGALTQHSTVLTNIKKDEHRCSTSSDHKP